MTPILEAVYADNGEHSHYRILDTVTGENLFSEDPEEDARLGLPVKSSIYEKMWNTLKAESGYRKTINHCAEILGREELNCTLKELMENIEKRAQEQLTAIT